MRHFQLECSDKNLLLVDDEPANLRVLAGHLEALGFDLTMALDGESALEKARRRPPDLILLDVRMPRLDGYETCRQLKADPALRDIPVIFLSALRETVDKVAGFEAGGADFISKPFQEQELLARIGVHLSLGELQARLREGNHQLRERNQRLKETLEHFGQAQQALRDSEARNRLLLESTREGIMGLDRQGRCSFCNRAAAQMLGYGDPQSLVGREVDALIHCRQPDGTPYSIKDCPIRAAYLHGDSRHCGHQVLWRADGSKLPVELRSSPVRQNDQLVGAVLSFQDISERLKNEQKLRLSATVLAASDEAVMFCDVEHRIIAVNPAFTKTTGFTDKEVLGKLPTDFLHAGKETAQTFEHIWQAVRKDGFWRGETLNRRKSGERFPCWFNASEVRDARGRLTHYVAVFSDISALKQSHERMEHLAYHDLLTGLPNRLLLQDRLQQAIEKAKRHKSAFAVLFMDLDRFKPINDTLGHSVGDRLLQEVAKRLRPLVRSSDTVARMGGDEFVTLLEEIAKPEDASRVARKMIETLNRPVTVEEHTLHVGASIGIGLYPRDGEDADELLRVADVAMYAAKEEYGNGFRFFTRSLGDEVQQRSRIEALLEEAVERGELLLQFQPQYSLFGGKLEGAEALLCRQDPQRGPVPLGELMPLLEDGALILRIGEWLLREACRQAGSWRDAGLSLPRISVYLSARQLRSRDFPGLVQKVLRETRLEVWRLQLEVTEGMLMERPEAALPVMEALHRMGVELVVDGFRTGFYSLRDLSRFPVDKLKLGSAFVCDLPGDLIEKALGDSVLALGRSLRLQMAGNGGQPSGGADRPVAGGGELAPGIRFHPAMSGEQLRALLEPKATPESPPAD